MRAARTGVIAATLLAAAGSLPSRADGGRSAEALVECVRANVPERSGREVLRIRSEDRFGGVRESRATLSWKTGEEGRRRALLRFAAPADLRGTALLLIETPEGTDLLSYLPELRRVRRVTDRMLSGPMFDMGLSYEEFERLQDLVDDAEVSRLPDAEVAGRMLRVLSLAPEPVEGAALSRVRAFVDPETCVPLVIELFEGGEEPTKVVTAEPASVERVGEYWIPRSLRVRETASGRRTELEVEAIELGVELPDRLFTESELLRGH